MQGCAFRGDDESVNSTNRGNFIELIKLQSRVNKEFAEVVLSKSQVYITIDSIRVTENYC